MQLGPIVPSTNGICMEWLALSVNVTVLDTENSFSGTNGSACFRPLLIQVLALGANCNYRTGRTLDAVTMDMRTQKRRREAGVFTNRSGGAQAFLAPAA